MTEIPAFLYATARSADRDQIARGLSLAFGFSAARAQNYVENVGIDAFRLLSGPGGVAASAALVPTGHFLGGASVPAVNICHVAVAPEWRGQGLARMLLARMEDEARAQGAVLATLFASARPVYRKLGYELAGSEIIYEAETSALPTRPSVSWQALTGKIEGHLAKAPALRAKHHNGLLDRAPAHWRELLATPRHALALYAIDGDVASGFVLIDTADDTCMIFRDWHAANGVAAEAILSFASGFRSVYPKLRWHGAPADDLVFAMPDKGWRLFHQEEWMGKLLDPQKALARRGYECEDAQMDFIFSDTDEARFGLAIARGKATVTKPTGKAGIALRQDDLTPLFTGFRSAHFLARAGRLSGDAAAIAQADRIFAGPAPWVGEHF